MGVVWIAEVFAIPHEIVFDIDAARQFERVGPHPRRYLAHVHRVASPSPVIEIAGQQGWIVALPDESDAVSVNKRIAFGSGAGEHGRLFQSDETAPPVW